MPAQILVVDDHAITRTAICRLLEWHSLHICGEAANGEEAVEKVAQLKPDFVLLDFNMPVMNGLTAAREIRRISPTTKIIFLTVHDSAAVVEATLLCSDGFVAKPNAATELIPLIEHLMGTAPARKAAQRGGK